MKNRKQNNDMGFSPGSHAMKPRLGFLGVGWIGLNRMKAIARSGMADIIAVCDLSENCISEATEVVPRVCAVFNPEEIFSYDLDGIVIATPNALHAEQSIRALKSGMAVFCQKPLGRNTEETVKIFETAKKADRLLGVDFSYRFTSFKLIYDLIRAKKLGDIYAVNLTFHNAYGPDKEWFYDPLLSGGGCVIDLGIHLVDLALWCLGFPEIGSVQSNCFRQGKPVDNKNSQVEDFAAAQILTSDGTVVQLACSWNLSAGQEAVIEATFYGTKGSASFTNVKGSFFDFQVEQFRGTQRRILASPPDDWSGRAAMNWLEQLSADPGFNEEAVQYIQTARVIDKIYKRS